LGLTQKQLARLRVRSPEINYRYIVIEPEGPQSAGRHPVPVPYSNWPPATADLSVAVKNN